MSNKAVISPVDRFGLTLFVAVVFHATIILGISFSLEQPKKQPPTEKTLEIMIVQHPKKAEKPEKADFLSQTSQTGGGEQQEKVRPKTVVAPPIPTPAPVPVKQNLPVKPPAPEPERKKPKKVLTKKAPAKKATKKKSAKKKAK